MADDRAPERRLPPIVAWGFGLGVAGLWLAAFVQLVCMPEQQLTTNLLVDDAYYYTVPARNLLEGHGFSFDGLERTNGVQTLWALVTIALQAVISDPTTMLRALIGFSALCWGAGAVLLFFWLRRTSVAAALVAAAGLAWSAMHERAGFQGMENGLHVLLGMLVLFAGARAVAASWSLRSTLWLGAALAVFALNRTEAALVGPVVALPLLLGRLGAPAEFGQRVRRCVWLALPGVLLVGGAMLFSRVVFDSWLPISGSVKQFYEDEWGRDTAHGGVFENIGWHLRNVSNQALGPLREQLPAWLSDLSGVRERTFRNVVWAFVIVGGVVLARRRFRFVTPRPGHAFVWCFALYAFLHLLMMGLLLPHFTNYGTWYFGSETAAMWLLIGALVVNVRGRWLLLPLGVGALLAVAGFARAGNLQQDAQTNVFRKAGHWLVQHTEPEARIGALSAGGVGWYARDRHVVNLDGLVNNRRYLDDFLRPKRVHDYFEDRGLTWFSDYQSLAAWKNGLTWCGNVPADRMVPRAFWNMPNDHAYVIWRVLPQDATFELLGENGPDVRDRYVELAVAAEIHGRFPVVTDWKLEDALREPGDLAVARSIPTNELYGLRHVLATREQFRQIRMTRATVHPQHANEVQVTPDVAVVGFDEQPIGADELAVTIYWAVADGAFIEEFWLQASTSDGSLQRVRVGRLHGTMPMQAWPHWQDAVTTETVVVRRLAGEDPRLSVVADGERVLLRR